MTAVKPEASSHGHRTTGGGPSSFDGTATNLAKCSSSPSSIEPTQYSNCDGANASYRLAHGLCVLLALFPLDGPRTSIQEKKADQPSRHTVPVCLETFTFTGGGSTAVLRQVRGQNPGVSFDHRSLYVAYVERTAPSCTSRMFVCLLRFQCSLPPLFAGSLSPPRAPLSLYPCFRCDQPTCALGTCENRSCCGLRRPRLIVTRAPPTSGRSKRWGAAPEERGPRGQGRTRHVRHGARVAEYCSPVGLSRIAADDC